MTQPAATLPELLDQLGKTYSPFERLKILGRAWSVLRHMKPNERLVVAGQLGLDRADEIVEAIARHSGTQASPILLSMIDQAQKKGTAHLPELIADLKDPGKRAERLRQGAMTAAETLTGEAPPPPWLPAGVATGEKPKPGVPPPAPPAPMPPPSMPPASTAPPPQPPQLHPPRPSPPPAPPAIVPTPVVHETVPAPAPAATAPPEPQIAKPRPAPPPPKPVPEPEPVQSPAALPAGETEVPRRLLERFRQLHRTLDDTRGLPPSILRSLVEEFPDGWARRRALLELLRTGNPPGFRDALSLLDTLGSERDRLWCLGTLAESRKLAPGDRDALLAAAPSTTARRRLERRLGEP